MRRQIADVGAQTTLAHYLADEAQKSQIETVFRTIAERILAGAATDDLRATLRRSPLAPTTVNSLKEWLEANRVALTESLRAETFLATLSAVVLQYNRSSAITSLSDRSVMPDIIERWVQGADFTVISRLLTERGIRIGGNNRHPTVEA